MQNDLQNSNLKNEVVDLEDYAKKGKTPPKGHKYKIKIDRENYTVDKECMTGAEILLLTGTTPPDRFQLRMKRSNGNVVTIQNDQTVCFTDPGIEKFKTLPLDQTEGKAPRRGFSLLEEDECFLNSLGLEWETAIINNENWVFIYDYLIPQGYNTNMVTLGVRVSANYPLTQLDMLYFSPSLNRLDGKPIKAISQMILDGKEFQQWSRHRTASNPWRPDVDNLSTHIPLADVWLELELKKN